VVSELSPDRLPHYLAGLGWPQAAAILAVDWLVIERSRRHRSFEVRTSTGGHFVKQVRGDRPRSAQLLEREAIWYELCARQWPAVAAMMPLLQAWDPLMRVLVLARVDAAGNLAEPALRSAAHLSDWPRQLGQLLAILHGSTSTASDSDAAPACWNLLGQDLPWIVHMAQGQPLPADIPQPGRQLLSQVLADEDLRSGLLALGKEWRTECVIHGDLRWDNCLVRRHGLQPSLVLVDWETVSCGDPAWDLGALMASLLEEWLSALDASAHTTGAATGALHGQAAAAEALWCAYWQHRQTRPPASLLAQVLRCAAGVLVQSAFEQVCTRGSPADLDSRQLQLAANIFRQPLLAAHDLLGLRP
jgi:hypothetical protein